MSKLASILAVAAVSLGAAACHRGSTSDPEVVLDGDAAAKVLEETPWLDRLPEREQDVIKVWVFARNQGAYVETNAYRGAYEVFSYFVEDDELRIRFPEDGKSHKVKYKIARVASRVFDYKLTFDQSPRGPKVYYGFSHDHALPAGVAAVLARVTGPK